MKKTFFFLLLAIFLASFLSAQKSKPGGEIKEWNEFENKEMGIRFRYPIRAWQVFIDKKTLDFDGQMLVKDLAILKKAAGFAHIRVHILFLEKDEDYESQRKSFRDAILKEKIGTVSRGGLRREMTQEELNRFQAQKGSVLGLEYRDKYGFVNIGYLYFLKKEKRLYLIEMYYERFKPEKGDEREKRKPSDNPDFQILSRVIDTLTLF